MDLEGCIINGYLERIPPDTELAKKELSESDYDLRAAQAAFGENDFKWSIVKAYYSMFHAARGLLFSAGLREKRHFAILVALEDMYKQGKLEGKHVSAFDSAMSAREDADHRYTYSRETASVILEAAQDFSSEIKSILRA